VSQTHKAVWHLKCTPHQGRLKCITATTISEMEGNNPMKNLFVRLWKEEEGQDLTEYGLLVVLIALASIAAMKTLASGISTVFSNASSSMQS